MSSSNPTIILYGKLNTSGVWGAGSGVLTTPDGKQWTVDYSVGSNGGVTLIVSGITISEWLQNYNNSSGTFTLTIQNPASGTLQQGTTIQFTLSQGQGTITVGYNPNTQTFTLQINNLPTPSGNQAGAFYLISDNQSLLQEIADALNYLGQQLISKSVSPYFTGGGAVYQDPNTGKYYTYFEIYGVGGSGGQGQLQYNNMSIGYTITSNSISIVISNLNPNGGGTVTGALSA